jgi:hypothetical protein
METTSGKETIIVLRRLIAYSEKIFQLSKKPTKWSSKPMVNTDATSRTSRG